MPSRSEISGQHWETVTFSNKPTTQPKPSALTTNTGNVPGPAITKSGKNATALENETEELKHQTCAPELKKAIMQARAAKQMTQKALALQLGCDAKTIQEYESGKAIPNNALIAKMERALGAKLPRARRK